MRWFKREPALPPEDDDASLGNVLVRMMVLDERRLAEVIEAAGARGIKLGETAVQLGYCSRAELEMALGIQEKMRAGEGSSALLDEMQARLDRFSAGEDMLTAQIELSREQSRLEGEESGVWVLPLEMRRARG